MYLENRWKRLHMFGKSSFLDLEPSTIQIHADSVSFLTSTDDRIQKYSLVDVWLFLDKSIGEFLMLYKKCVL